MAINFPGSLDNFTNPTSASPINSPSHADQHANANDAIEALEAKVGVDNSTVITSHDYKIAQLQSLVTSAVAGAKSIYQDVRNQSGSAFTKATPVYVSGSTGASGQLLVSAASNATESTSSKTMGITTSAISNNSNGQVISEGILEGIDTTGAADGDPVWLGVNGAKIYGLANKPSAPAHLVFLGVVIRGGQANTGSMYVKIQNGFELQEIHNVEISSLVNGNILAYDSTTQTWKNTNTIQSTSSTTPLVVKGTSSPSANIFEVQNSSGYPMVYVDAYGALVARASGMYVNSGYASGTGLVVRGYASQTANLQEWQNSNGTVLASIDANGQASFKSTTLTASSSGVSSLTLVAASGQTAPLLITSGGAQIPAGGNYFRAPGIEATYVMNVTSGNLGTIPFIVKGAASQTADLQQWQDSAGTVLAYVAANGHLLTPRLNITNGGNIVDSAGTTPYFAFGSNQIAIYARNAAYKPLVIQGAASQSANLQEWQDSSGSVITRIGPNGHLLTTVQLSATSALTAGTNNYLTASLSVIPLNASIIGAVIRRVTSQTADLMQWQDQTGGILGTINKDGAITLNSSTSLGAALNAYTSWSGATGIIVKGSASQTANLQEWQDSSGNVLSKIDSFGAFKTASTASFGTISGGGVWGGYAPVVEIRNTSASTSAINIFANGGPAIRVYDGSGYQRGAWNQDGSIVVGQSNTKLATLSVYADSATSVGTIIRGAASQTANLQQWQNSSGTVLSSFSSNGRLAINTTEDAGGRALYVVQPNGGYGAMFVGAGTIPNVSIYAASGGVGLLVSGVASQTANLQEWQNSSGTVLANIDSTGRFLSTRPIRTDDVITSGSQTVTLGQISAMSSGAGRIGLVVRGAVSQAVNLQEWQNNAGTILLSITPDGSIKGGNSNTISVNTASTVDTVALSSFTSMEYTLSIKQGSKIRSSKVLVHTDGTSVDSTEYGIMEMGGGITGILVTASVSGTDAILQITITDAATTNATVKLIKTML
jgi:hypothetical protein